MGAFSFLPAGISSTQPHTNPKHHATSTNVSPQPLAERQEPFLRCEGVQTSVGDEQYSVLHLSTKASSKEDRRHRIQFWSRQCLRRVTCAPRKCVFFVPFCNTCSSLKAATITEPLLKMKNYTCSGAMPALARVLFTLLTTSTCSTPSLGPLHWSSS